MVNQLRLRLIMWGENKGFLIFLALKLKLPGPVVAKVS